ncbi:hypothetical protein DFS34DRAFT_684688 [Phlyctochytrium arcticum]|nr:hypothetical protein DFS34DRAFT_684688 [Phlyctochytrium arcticum]
MDSIFDSSAGGGGYIGPNGSSKNSYIVDSSRDTFRANNRQDEVERDLMFMVARLLSTSKCSRTFKVLLEELEELQPKSPMLGQSPLLPIRTDWLGRPRHQTYDELVEKNTHIRPKHLPQLIERLTAIAGQSESHSWLGTQTTLLGIGLHSLSTNGYGQKWKGPSERARRKQTPARIRDAENGATLFPRITNPFTVFYRRFESLATVRGHICAIYNGIWDRTGSIYCTGGDDSLVKVWCARTGLLMRTLRGHATFLEENGQAAEHHYVLDMCINEENTLLATASSDGTVHVWSTITWEPVTSIAVRKNITRIAFSPSPLEGAQCLVVGTKDGKTRVYRWDAQKQTYETKPLVWNTHDKRTDQVLTLAFNRTGTRFVVGGTDGLIYFYKLIPKAWSPNQEDGPDGSDADTFSWTLIDKLEASSLTDKEKDISRNRLDISVKELKFNRKGDRFASGCADGTARIWSHNPEKKAWTSLTLFAEPDPDRSPIRTNTTVVRQVPNNPNAPTIIPQTNADDALPDLTTIPMLLASPTSAASAIPPLDPFSPGVLPATIPDNAPSIADPMVESVPVADADSADAVEEDIPGLTALCWSQDDARLITIVADCQLRVWDSRSGELLKTLDGHTCPAWILDSHPIDPRIVLSAGHDGRLIIWDIEAGVELKRFEIEHALLEASFSMDGDMIAAVDLFGQTHFFGTGADPDDYYLEFYEQFFPSDFAMVRAQPDGSLLDVQNNMAPHLVRRGMLVDIRQSPYFIEYVDLREKCRLDRPFSVDHQYISDERETKLMLLEDERSSLPNEQQSNWSDQTKKSRRKARTILTETEPDLEIIEALNSIDPIFPLPESSGDEYAGEEDDSAEDGDWGDASDSSHSKDVGNFVVGDDEIEMDRSPRKKSSKKVKTKRKPPKRRLRSDEDDEDEEDESRPKRRKLQARSYRENEDWEGDDVDGDGFSSGVSSPSPRPVAGPSSDMKKAIPRPPKLKFKVTKPLPGAITVASDWVSADQAKRTPYLPQIGDLVAYIREGHRQFLQSARQSGDYVQHEVDDDRPEVVFGVIDKLHFLPGEPVSCLLSLHVHESKHSMHEPIPGRHTLQPVLKGGRKDILKIHYWDHEGCSDFVILFDHYAGAMYEQWEVQDEVLADYAEGRYRGNIEAITEQISPWCKYRVRWQDPPYDSELLSAWELHSPGEIDDEVPSERLSGEEMTRICDILVKWRDREDVVFFLDEVPYESYPTYLTVNPYPMFLTKILNRLSNAFYRRVEAVAWDVEVMMDNAKRFNVQGSDLYEIASNILPQLRDEILGDRSKRRKSVSSLNGEMGASSSAAAVPPKLVSRRTIVDSDDESQISVTVVDDDTVTGQPKGSRSIKASCPSSKIRNSQGKRKRVVSDDDDDGDEYHEEDVSADSFLETEDEDAIGSVDGEDSESNESPQRYTASKPAKKRKSRKKRAVQRSQKPRAIKKAAVHSDSEYEEFSGDGRSKRNSAPSRTRRASSKVSQLPSPPSHNERNTALRTPH